ncbi:class E sortase [Citricoccus sp. K5]|uniref:class E sortase n=1 Tax=Citricoccus sp. K5 TaxID=2653135 RepID=UPI0012F084EE|nr:class E sortase [Citricoccus sp. K5]VXB61895.1 Sortase A [Citricoccus sp. K5]
MTSTLDRPPSRRASRRKKPRRGVLSVLGRLFIILGILVGLYGVYELFITDVIAESDRTEVATQWRAEQAPVDDGIGAEYRDDFPVVEGDGTLGMLHVPSWGDDFEVPIGSGDGADVLDAGQVGHYDATQPIGAMGNAGLAGHRTTHGKPLREVHHLEQGHEIVVESADHWFVYKVVAKDIVKPHQSEVLDPIPPFEGATQGRYLTLTTCDPIFGITDRYIVWAEADYWTPKSEGLPPALAS